MTSRWCTRRPAGWASCSCSWCGRAAGRWWRRPGGPEKCETARAVGAEHVIDYRAVDDLAGEVRRLTDGRGVDVAYDGVGKDTFDASLASLRPRGLLVLFGAASGQVPPFDIQRLNTGRVAVPDPAHRSGTHLATPEELQWRAGEVLGAVADGSLHVAIGGRYPLTEAATRVRRPRGPTHPGQAAPHPLTPRGSRLRGSAAAGPEDGDEHVEQGQRTGGVDQLRAGALALALLGRGDLRAGHDRDGDEQLDADLGVVDLLVVGLHRPTSRMPVSSWARAPQTRAGVTAPRATKTALPMIAAMPSRWRTTNTLTRISMATP